MYYTCVSQCFDQIEFLIQSTKVHSKQPTRKTKIKNKTAMKNLCQKCNIFLYSILIHSVRYALSAGGSSEEETSSNKVLPIILMKKSDVFEFEPPNDVSLEPVFLFWKNMDFYSDSGLYERYFCPADKSQRNQIKKTREKMATGEKNHTRPLVSDNCLFANSFMKLQKFFGVMPHCRKEPEPLISKIFQTKRKIIDEKNDESNVNLEWSSCGFKGENKLYRFGYQIWFEPETLDPITNFNPPLFKFMVLPLGDIIDYEIFRFCYDHSVQEVSHTKYKILSPGLLSNKELKEELAKPYPTSILKYDNDELDFQNIINTYQQVASSKTTNLLDYQMEKLVPPDDFSFILWKKPTFHYMNEKPMHVNLIKMWREINELIQARAKSTHLEYDIYTGTFDISVEEGKNKTPKTADEIKIPQIWIKIVQLNVFKPEYAINVNDGIAIIANNHMNDALEKKIISEYCKNKRTYEYHSKNEPTVSNSEKSTYIRSCLVTEKIQNLFGLDLQIRGTIELF